MIADFDIEEGVVIIYEDGACFALLVDAEHLDAELIGVGGCAALAAATLAASTTARRNRTVVSGATSIIG